MCAWLQSSNDSYSQFPQSPLGMPSLGLQPPFFVLNMKKNNGLQIMSLAAYSSKTNKPLLLNKPPVSIKPPPLPLKCV